jgi:hypothetical protein
VRLMQTFPQNADTDTISASTYLGTTLQSLKRMIACTVSAKRRPSPSSVSSSRTRWRSGQSFPSSFHLSMGCSYLDSMLRLQGLKNDLSDVALGEGTGHKLHKLSVKEIKHVRALRSFGLRAGANAPSSSSASITSKITTANNQSTLLCSSTTLVVVPIVPSVFFV